MPGESLKSAAFKSLSEPSKYGKTLNSTKEKNIYVFHDHNSGTLVGLWLTFNNLDCGS